MRRPLAIAVLSLAACGEPARVQPIAYNHDVHVGKLQIDCTTCHEGARDQISAGLPALEICAQCHADAEGSAEQRKTVAAVAANQELAWVRLFELPRHVFFSHRRHTETAKIACEDCHGLMKKQTRPPPGPLVTLTMDTCIGCHHKRGASEDCSACHR